MPLMARRRPVVLGVPTLNRYDLLPRMLRSVADNGARVTQLIVVDNGGSMPRAAVEPLRTSRHIVVPGENLGVARSWNLIIKLQQLLHPGTELVIASDDVVLERDAIERMRRERAPVVLGAGFALFLWRLPHDGDFVFDEGFWPAYCEDIDMMIRLKRAGQRVTQLSGVLASHTVSATLERKPGLRHQCAFSTKHFVRKWGKPPQACEGDVLQGDDPFYETPYGR